MDFLDEMIERREQTSTGFSEYVDQLYQERYPDSSPALRQRIAALETANRLRLQRAADKREIKAAANKGVGLQMVYQLVDGGLPDFWVNASVSELLCCVPRVGKYTARRVASAMGLSGSDVRFSGLEAAQVEAFLDEVASLIEQYYS